ncbi:HNH endonuclease [Thiomicrospira sp. ALE5]|uniref:HNH endonuclease n=1 Tax=Thiomicrospira sp. ALE5 TaxID=748650 RepID=UPI0008DEFC71|nr:HNH endonuclease [Thiomicrospira sp. ALE5]SFR52599.1 Predicted restriction endonuclease [Thiomicrospira sp. ALE5]
MSKEATYKAIENIANKFGFLRDVKTTRKRSTGEWAESDKTLKFSKGNAAHFYIVKNDSDSKMKLLAVFHPNLKERLNKLSGQRGLPSWTKVLGDKDWKHNASLKEFPKRLNKGKEEIGYGYPISFEGASTMAFFERVLNEVYACSDLPSTTDSDSVLPLPTDDITLRLIEARQGQGLFRSVALEKFNSTCVVTGSKIVAILEAAHIMPYADVKDTRQDNALLMRSDVHTLFDLGLVRVEVQMDELVVKLTEELMSTEYAPYHGKILDLSLSEHMKTNVSERNLKYVS